MKKILFITQNMDRTGSEMVLWYLLNNVDKSEYSIHVFCLRRGTLYHALPNHIQKSVVYKNSGLLRNKVWRTLLKMCGKDPLAYELKALHNKIKPDYWYVNTLAIPWVYQVAKKVKAHVVTHLHELLYAFSFIKANEFKMMIEESKTIIGCSEEVCERVRKLGHKDVRLQFSFVDENSIYKQPERIAELKGLHGINSDDFVWVISGATTYMKGFDFILALLEEFKEPNIKFLWIGRQIDDGLNYYIDTVAKTKFKDKLIFVGPQDDDYYNYLSIGNGLLLISREESFSLVTIEAAFLGLPTLGFDVGIAKSFIKEGMGEIVEEGNLNGLKNAMNRMHNYTFDAVKLKKEAYKYSVENQLPQYQQLLNEL